MRGHCSVDALFTVSLQACVCLFGAQVLCHGQLCPRNALTRFYEISLQTNKPIAANDVFISRMNVINRHWSSLLAGLCSVCGLCLFLGRVKKSITSAGDVSGLVGYQRVTTVPQFLQQGVDIHPSMQNVLIIAVLKYFVKQFQVQQSHLDITMQGFSVPSG